MKFIQTVLAILFLPLSYFGQFTGTFVTTLCDGGSDVYLASGDPNTNYGFHPTLGGNTWSCGGSLCLSRGLFAFNFPSTLVVVSAKLELWADLNWSSSPTTGPNNQGELKRVTGTWSEFITDWSTQPQVSTINMVTVPASTSTAQNYTLNVTALVKDMQTYGNNGFMLNMVDEVNFYKSLQFASSNNSALGKCPRLTIVHTIGTGVTEFSAQANTIIAPSPFDNAFKINCNKIIDHLLIKNILGTIVSEEWPHNNEFNFSGNLASGAYCVEGFNESGQTLFSKKIICVN